MGKDWYKSSSRRNLVDMHIDEWDESFLSAFDADDYHTYLKETQTDAAMLYLQSHVGLCYYPTKSGKMHNALIGREDVVKRLVDKCRADGIAVVGYYSLIFNTYEEDRHPEWRMVKDEETGLSARQMGSRYGHCCPNNQGYRTFLKEQIKEIADYFTLDGIFYDMTYWSGLCRCKSCKQRFQKETGIDSLPDMTDLRHPRAMLLLKKRYEWIAEFARWITDYTHNLMPNVTVTHNNAYGVSGNWKQASWEGVSDCSDFCTGDLYGDIYDHSFCMKYFLGASQNQPFEYMVSRFSKNLKQHTVSKTHTELTQDMLLTAAHHGANFIIDAIDPVGTLNHGVARMIGDCFEDAKPYEPYTRGDMGHILSDVAVWYSTTGRYNSEENDFDSRSCACALSKTLSRGHLPYTVIANTASGRLAQYPMVLAPAIAGLEEEHLGDIRRYIEGGGIFYFSGTEQKELLQMLGMELKGYEKGQNTYIAPLPAYEELFAGFSRKYPLPMSFTHPRVELSGSDCRVLATLTLPYGDPEVNTQFASIHSNPPGIATEIPSVVEFTLGKGRVLWSALPIEMEGESHPHRQAMMHLIERYLPQEKRRLICHAPMQVEAVSFCCHEGVEISLIDMGVNEDRIPMPPAAFSLALDRRPQRVILLPSEEPVDFTYQEGRVHFQARPLDLFDMYKICY